MKNPDKLIGYFLVVVGLLFLASSLDYQNIISAFIGLTLVFWGSILVYIRPVTYVREPILTSTLQEMLKGTHSSLDYEGYHGKPVYRNKTNLEEMQNVEIIITKDEESSSDTAYIKKITPPGLGLHLLMEKEMGINFNAIGIEQIKHQLPRYIVGILEAATSVTIDDVDECIQVKIENSVFQKTCYSIIGYEMKRYLGDPLVSALACIFSRAINTGISIDKIDLIDDKYMVIRYLKVDTK